MLKQMGVVFKVLAEELVGGVDLLYAGGPFCMRVSDTLKLVFGNRTNPLGPIQDEEECQNCQAWRRTRPSD